MNQDGFLTRNIAGLTAALESVILNEELSRTRGLLQGLDPRVKLLTLVLLIVNVGLARSFWIFGTLLALVILLDYLSGIPMGFFIRRVLLFLPFTAIIALPALFITPGSPLLQTGSRVIITVQGAQTAGFLLLRVMDSVSFGLLLVLTTPWSGILQALRWFRLPAIVVDILSMTYRYIFLFLHTANALFLARRSRSLGTFSATENRRWLTRALGSTLARSQHLGEEVYLAMLARGYQGEIYSLERLRWRQRDHLWLIAVLAVCGALLWSIYR